MKNKVMFWEGFEKRALSKELLWRANRAAALRIMDKKIPLAERLAKTDKWKRQAEKFFEAAAKKEK